MFIAGGLSPTSLRILRLIRLMRALRLMYQSPFGLARLGVIAFAEVFGNPKTVWCCFRDAFSEAYVERG